MKWADWKERPADTSLCCLSRPQSMHLLVEFRVLGSVSRLELSPVFQLCSLSFPGGSTSAQDKGCEAETEFPS